MLTPETRQALKFLRLLNTSSGSVNVKVEVEQRVPDSIEEAVVAVYKNPTYVRMVEGEDFYASVQPDIMIRGRDDIIDGERIRVYTVKLPFDLVPNLPEYLSPPMLEFKGKLTQEELERMKALGIASTVSVKRRSVYLDLQDENTSHPLEVSYDLVRSLDNAHFTELSQDIPVGDISSRRFVVLLEDLERRGADNDLLLGVMSELGYSQQLMATSVSGAHLTVVKTLEGLTAGKGIRPERRTYPEIQLEDGYTS